MEIRGHVRKGVVVLPAGTRLEEGTEVSVRPVHPRKSAAGGGVVSERPKLKAVKQAAALTKPGKAAAKPKPQGRTLYEQLKDVVGKAEGLPTDLALNHDHYLRGTPKK